MIKRILRTLFKQRSDGNYKPSRKLISFIICLTISLFFWFITTFSKEYSTTINFPVSYSNYSKGRMLMNHLPKEFEIDISAKGFTLLYYKYIHGKPAVKIDLKEAKPSFSSNSYFIALNNKIEKYSKQFGGKIKINRINPDTLYLDYRKRIVKTIPIKLVADISYEKEYELTDSVRINPSSITIAGPEELLVKIKNIETQKIKFEGVDSEINEEVDLAFSFDTSLVNLSTFKTNITIPVTKYTEGNLDIPIEVNNLPANKSIKLFPSKVTVKYYVPFNEYDKIDETSFKARVDYSKKSSGKRLKVEVVKKPSSVKTYKISPDKVEFILRK